MSFCSYVLWRLKERKFNKEWRQRNPENKSVLKSWVPFSMVSVGRGTYGNINIISDNYSCRLVIGNYCSLADDIKFILGAEHSLERVSSFPFKTKMLCVTEQEGFSKGDIIIDDDVWIGYGAIILSGVHIGQGAVVAADAVVSKDVPPYAIVGGVPAQVIKYRFDQAVIKYLITLNYRELNETLIQEHIDCLYKPIDDIDLNEIETLYSWFPKKR